jgi:hypothetical protein
VFCAKVISRLVIRARIAGEKTAVSRKLEKSIRVRSESQWCLRDWINLE